MTKYRKKPVVIDAVIWDGSAVKMEAFLHTDWGIANDKDDLVIFTLEGDMFASIGDYIIKGVQGEFYPCKPDIFALTYEEVGYERKGSKL